jgi:glycosyltransferase involved in cell wall biosynthesis
MNRPSVSVVVPAYNHAPYVRMAIDSILAQTQPADEIVVVDDGSTDGTAQLLEWYGTRIRLFRRQHEGIAANYNFGVERTRSEWIAFVESDDALEPDYLEATTAFLVEHPECAWVSTARRVIDESGRPTGEVQRKISSGPDYTVASFLRKDMGLASTPVVRRRALLDVGPFDAPAYGIDTDMALRFALRHRMSFLDRPLYLYRRHATNTSRSRLRNLEEVNDILRRLIERQPDFAAREPMLLRRCLAQLNSAIGVSLAETRQATDRSDVLPWLIRAIRQDPFSLKHYRRIAVVSLFGVRFFGWWRRVERRMRLRLQSS